MWVYILIGIIVLLIIAVAVLLYIRNKKNNDIENLISELERVRLLPYDKTNSQLNHLNLHGELKAFQSNWKSDWLKVLEVNGRTVENSLEKAKTEVEQFRFRPANENMQVAEGNIRSIQEKYDAYSKDVEDFLNTTKESEKSYQSAEKLFREAKRDVLANGHQFGESERSLERLISSFEPELKEYKRMINDGDYRSAHQHIYELKEDLASLKQNMDEIPILIKDVQKDLPQQFQEIRYGCRELKSEGYDLDHIQVENTLSDLKFKLNRIEPMITELELDEARREMSEINTKIDDMLELIEHEVKSKAKVDQEKDILTDKLFQAKNANYMLRTEIDYIKDQFHMNESDVHNVHKYENEIENLIDIYDDIVTETDKAETRYSKLVDNVAYLKTEVEKITTSQDRIQEYLVNLREDEKEARHNSQYIEERKDEVYRELTMANLSSIPERFIVMKHEIDLNLQEIEKYFMRRPMNIKFIKDKVNSVVIDLNKFEQEVFEIIHEAELTEVMIQYGNRYRRDDEEFSILLNEAERLFKENRYKRALEIVKSALDKVEPGASQRIERAFENNN